MALTSTSLPFFKLRQAIARCKAVVPLETATANFVLLNLAKFFSKELILSAKVPEI